MEKKKVRRPRKFFIKDNNDIAVVDRKFFDTLSDRNEALGFGIHIYSELQNALKEDAMLQSVAYIGTIEIVKGLERSLDELEKRFPFILKQIHNTDRRNGGLRIGRS